MIIFIFIFGLVIGSFLNSVVFRLHKKQTFLVRRSYCPKCKHELGSADLVPLLSFLIQKGRCRYCRAKISWQYPLVELAAGIIFVLAFLKYFSPILLLQPQNWDQEIIYFFRDLFYISILIIFFVYDLKYYLISDKVVAVFLISFVAINSVLIAAGWQSVGSFLNLAIAALAGGLFFLIQILISKGKWVGGGDVRLGLVMGLMLGWPGLAVALFIAYTSGAVVGIVLLFSKIKKMKSMIPFGPFLALGTFVALLYGERILEWYWRDLGLFLLK
jgi:prepilin signal peptidase PulO-like enzyme (type II secretory pathway)